MKFYTFGKENNPIMILIHGVLSPWQIWEEHINFFANNYYVVVPALDGHIEEEYSEYISVQDEANKISEYIINTYGKNVEAVCGLSMGGAIAYKIFENNQLNIKFLVIDGGPLSPLGKLPIWIMKNSYMSIIHKSKTRDTKTLKNFKKNFLPEKYLNSYLKFADTMTDSTISNMIDSVFNIRITGLGNEKNTAILFMHGTKWNEIVSIKAAKRMCKLYPNTEVKCFKGYKHGELAIYHSKEWIETVNKFILGTKEK